MSELLARIDLAIAELVQIRSALAPETDDPSCQPQEEDFVDTSTAAERFNLPRDTVRWLCENKGMGEKRGGRWFVSVQAMRDYNKRD
ncbi:hypothetical protein GOD62_29380 [Sinorhizobium medicae]|nr:hypothetical protein [Sinorhizobium medicae]MDX0796706.1 hypothetical protein [Sinorhizobium medicae]